MLQNLLGSIHLLDPLGRHCIFILQVRVQIEHLTILVRTFVLLCSDG